MLFHERFWHYGVPWSVSILAKITGQIILVVRLSSGRAYLEHRQLYVYIVPEGATFLDMINWRTRRPSTIGRRLIKMVETFAHNGYGAVLGPLLLSMYFNIHWYLRSVSNGEAPLRENCEVVCHPADHARIDSYAEARREVPSITDLPSMCNVLTKLYVVTSRSSRSSSSSSTCRGRQGGKQSLISLFLEDCIADRIQV